MRRTRTLSLANPRKSLNQSKPTPRSQKTTKRLNNSNRCMKSQRTSTPIRLRTRAETSIATATTTTVIVRTSLIVATTNAETISTAMIIRRVDLKGAMIAEVAAIIMISGVSRKKAKKARKSLTSTAIIETTTIDAIIKEGLRAALTTLISPRLTPTQTTGNSTVMTRTFS
jgi:hypothetical protein